MTDSNRNVFQTCRHSGHKASTSRWKSEPEFCLPSLSWVGSVCQTCKIMQMLRFSIGRPCWRQRKPVQATLYQQLVSSHHKLINYGSFPRADPLTPSGGSNAFHISKHLTNQLDTKISIFRSNFPIDQKFINLFSFHFSRLPLCQKPSHFHFPHFTLPLSISLDIIKSYCNGGGMKGPFVFPVLKGKFETKERRPKIKTTRRDRGDGSLYGFYIFNLTRLMRIYNTWLGLRHSSEAQHDVICRV